MEISLREAAERHRPAGAADCRPEEAEEEADCRPEAADCHPEEAEEADCHPEEAAGQA